MRLARPRRLRGRRVSPARFERLVREALRELPPTFARRLENVAILIADRPSPEQLRALGLAPGETLFGLYEGTPLAERGTGYHLALPDRITIFRQPIIEACGSSREIKEEVRLTVIHELGHFFGLGDADLP
ncbi:MAG: metallopeptidase family protein [Chloroflexi bacterium]|jgi:predicted Zn-dependent protease with MMP-like domain|nr:metallopeptidase family protein [Chloroflexota bacterium]